nr:MAG TPA: protein of unknown function (DUF5048) [Caudoviricetes sp.]
MLTTPDGQDIGLLDGVESGSVTLSATSRLRASGQLSLTETAQQIDWFNMHARVDYVPVGMEGWPVATFVMSSPTRSVNDHRVTRDVELLSTLAYLDRMSTDRIEQVENDHLSDGKWSLIKRYAAKAKNLRMGFTKFGDYGFVGGPSLINEAITYDVGTNVLTMLNDCARIVGWGALTPDPYGVITGGPYIRPSRRPVSFVFREGDAAIHSAEWTIDRDLFAVPNVVVCVGTPGSDDTQRGADKYYAGPSPAVVGVARNDSKTDPLSTVNRGEVVHVETGVKVTSQSAIDQWAARVLTEKSMPAATLVIEHLPVNIRPGDVIEFVSQGQRLRGTVQKMEIPLSPTALVKTEIKEIRNE